MRGPCQGKRAGGSCHASVENDGDTTFVGQRLDSHGERRRAICQSHQDCSKYKKMMMLSLPSPMSPRSRSLFGLTAVIVAGFLALGVILFTPAPAPADPAIAWTPAVVTKTLSPGETQTISASFVPSEDVRDAVVRVVPALEPFIKVTPSAFGSIRKGQSVRLEVTISIPSNSLPGNVDGTVQLRSGLGGNAKAFARPLPISFAVHWAEYGNSQLGYSFAYPPALTVAPSVDTSSTEVGFYTDPGILGGNEPLFTIHVDFLDPGASVLDFLHARGVTDDVISSVVVDGWNYLRWTESAGEGFLVTSYSALIGSDKVLTISSASTSFAQTLQFSEILSSLLSQ